MKGMAIVPVLRTFLILLLALSVAATPVLAQRPTGGPERAKRVARPVTIEEPAPQPSASSRRQPPANGRALFVENVGQFAQPVRFQLWGGPGLTWLTEEALWITLPQPRRGAGFGKETAGHSAVHLRLRFVGANPTPRLEPYGRVVTRVSYLRGADPARWYSDVPVWSGVRYVELYPGIDLVLGAEEGGGLAWWLELKGGESAETRRAALESVRLRIEGAEEVALAADDGRPLLRLGTALGEFALPLLTVVGDEGAKALAAMPGPTLQGDTVVAPFAVGTRDARLMVGSAGLRYATYLGGADWDDGSAIAVDAAGNAYVVGTTYSAAFPAGPGYDTTPNGDADAYVVKLSADGTSLVYATFLGGSSEDKGWDIAVDDAGCAYLTGDTYSDDFPAAAGPGYDSSYNGSLDAFVVKLNAEGTGVLYATYLGGNNDDEGLGIALDAAGCAYVTGSTYPGSPGAEFPAVLGPGYDTTPNDWADAYVVKLSADGTSLAYATFLGGRNDDKGYAIAVDWAGCAYVTGLTYSDDFPVGPGYDSTPNGDADAYVVKLDAAGTGLAYATYLGGTATDEGHGIAVDQQGAAYVTGHTLSGDFPVGPGYDTTANGDADAYVVKLEADGAALAYATYLGGSVADYGRDIAVDDAGCAYVTGHTLSGDFPVGPGYDTTPNGNADVYVVKLNGVGLGMVSATYLGGADWDYGLGIAVDGRGIAYVTGYTDSSDFPVGPGYDTAYNESDNAFVASLRTGSRGADVDGDGLMDLTVWRPSNGKWYTLYSTKGHDYYQATSLTWGKPGDIPLFGDVDGDGKADPIVWRNLLWKVYMSAGGIMDRGWGKTGDRPLIGDVDGDAEGDLVVWRPSNGRWYILYSSTGYDYYQAGAFTWGQDGDIPLLGDVDGDGLDDLIVWSSSAWKVLLSGGGTMVLGWGAAGDVPVTGDLDGDGQGDLVVWRPSNGRWYILYSSTGYDYYQAKAYTWGRPGDIPLLGDVDGDGKDDLIVWRNLLWKVALSGGDYVTWLERGWGKTGDIPMPCPWCPSAEDLPLPCLWCVP